MDLFFPRQAGDVFAALVGEMGRRCRRAGADTLEFRSLPAACLDRLGEWGAYRRTLEVNPFLVRSLRADLVLPAADPQAWFLVPGDGDGAGW